VLVGRAEERASIDRLLDEAIGGRSGVLVLRGDAGIGKTALLDYAAGRADAMTVVRALGVESEAELQFAGLLEVTRPLLGHLADLPARQAEALRGALGLGPAEEHDRYAIGAATLGLLAAAADATPLLVLADDAQWLDGPSADALLFAARRLEADRVALLFAARQGETPGFEAQGIPSIELPGLDQEDAERLLVSSYEGPVSDAVVELLCSKTGGNPLALIELPATLTPSQLDGTEPLPDPLPAGALVERAFVRRSESLPEETCRALLVCALSISGELDPIARALDSLGISTQALEPAEDADLIRLLDGVVEFRHALVRSAIVQAAAPSERRPMHRALAAVEQGERRAWHLGSAALGPDEKAAAALEEAAEQARERSGYGAAAAALERAARLSMEDAERTRRLCLAAEASWLAGRSERALALGDEALQAATSPDDRSRLLQLRGRIETLQGHVPSAIDHLLEAADLVEGSSPERAVEILADAVEALEFAGDVQEVLAVAERARRLAPANGSGSDLVCTAMLAEAVAQNGRATDAEQQGARVLEILAESEELRRSPHYLCRAALGLAWCDRVPEALELGERATALSRERGEIGTLTYSLETSAWMLGRSGRWSEAYATASEGLGLARETGQQVTAALQLTHLTWGDAFRGHEDACRAHGAEAAELAVAHGLPVVLWWVETGLGMLELGLGRPEEVVKRLEPVAAGLEEQGYFDRDISPHPNLVEAYVRLGRQSDAQGALERYRSYGPRTSSTWSPAVALRCEGLLADEDEFEAVFREAIVQHAPHDPFGLARTRLCLGERLRRAGRRRQARDELRVALDAFEVLGADPWVERARTELRASGERIRRRDAAEPEELTPQELQIALQVADGKTNKEVGSALFISHKTVEFHLHRIYRKLGISSRGELIRQFAAGTT
jgi:DNA-binding CsgD family transcriptional regulator